MAEICFIDSYSEFYPWYKLFERIVNWDASLANTKEIAIKRDCVGFTFCTVLN